MTSTIDAIVATVEAPFTRIHQGLNRAVINPLDALADLGWRGGFQSQLTLDDIEASQPVRVMAVHRGAVDVAGPGGTLTLPLTGVLRDEAVAVGDWLLLDRETSRPTRVLDRMSLFKRRAAGTGRAEQVIAANVDTLFIVTSCNQDFNRARLERYLALAEQAQVTPVIVLTKRDLSDDPKGFQREAKRVRPGTLVELVDGRDPRSVEGLSVWCGTGQTVALMGSSGVGKSTLVNTLTGAETLATAAIREDDARGRHTTTGRAMHRLPAGGWLLDTPGMRELQLVDVADGIDAVFDDIAALAQHCRFKDCQHEGEPGCAVQAAIADGRLDPDRLRRYRKLLAEDRFNTESLAERRARGKAFNKRARGAMAAKNHRQGI